jgi:hypothetical protein
MAPRRKGCQCRPSALSSASGRVQIDNVLRLFSKYAVAAGDDDLPFHIEL